MARLADYLLQLDVTYDIHGMAPAQLLARLPNEFGRFRPAAWHPPQPSSMKHPVAMADALNGDRSAEAKLAFLNEMT